MAEKDELGGTLPSQSARKTPSAEPPGEALPFEPAGRFIPLGDNGAEKELGRGGLGRVLLSRDAHLGRDVALKQMLPEILARGGSTADALAERFLREARITAGLEHPGVVPVYELGKRNDGSIYYAMKRVQGRTLAKALDSCASLDERLSLMPHLLDVVQTVAYAHARGVVHRDLKPDNVMVGSFGETQLLDWGLARAKDTVEPPASSAKDALRDPPGPDANPSQTVAGQAMGTPRYMSPEQAEGKVEQMDAQSDVWSLGVMLYELLAGRTPFEGKTAAELIAAVTREPIAPIDERDAPAALVEVAMKALARDRSRRYGSAVEMAEALSLALGVHADVHRRPLGWLAVTAALAAGLLITLGLWLSAPGEQPAAVGANVPLARAIAERAQAAWEDGDVFAASTLAAEAHAVANVPLGNGVETLVRLSGAPRKLWSVVVPGGCTSLAARGGVVACATLGAVALFDAGGKELNALKAGPGWQQAVAFLDESTLISAGDDKVVRSWNVQSREVMAAIPLPSDPVALAAATDGSAVYIGLRDGQVFRWPRETQQLMMVTKHDGSIRALAADERGFASSARDGVRVFASGTAKDPTLELDRPVSALRFSAEGLIAGLERDVFVVSPTSAVRWAGHLDDVTALASSRHWPLISGGSDRTVRAWIQGRPVARLSGFESAITQLAADPQWPGGPDLYLATRRRTLEAWQWPADARSPVLPELGMEPTSAAMAPDATVVLGFRDAKVMRLVGARNAMPVRGTEHTAPVRAVAVADQLALSGGDDGQVFVWAGDGPARLIDRNPSTRIRAIAVSADSNRAAWSCDDGTLVLWSLEFNREILREKDSPVNALAFAPTGATLALGRQDKQVVLLDTATGKPTRRLEGLDAAVNAVAFSLDGKTLASGDAQVSLWDVATGQRAARLTGAFDKVGAIAFSRDGATVAAGAEDGSVSLWDAAGFALKSEIRLHAGDVLALGFGPDGRLLVAGTDRTVRWLTVQ